MADHDIDVFHAPNDTPMAPGDGLQLDFSENGKFCVNSISGGHTWAQVFPHDPTPPTGNQSAGTEWPSHGKHAICSLPPGVSRIVITFSSAGHDEECSLSERENREEATEVIGHTITVGS